MSTQTLHLGLNKAELDDFVRDTIVNTFGANWEILDNSLLRIDNELDESTSTNLLAEDILLSGFVLVGMQAVQDGAVLTRINVSAGVCYVVKNGLKRHNINAQNFITSLGSATYYLDFQPDGTYSWGVHHSSQTGALAIAEVITNANGNIISLTDRRIVKPGVGIVNANWLGGRTPSDFAPISHVGSRGDAHGLATNNSPGFMSSSDKVAHDNHLQSRDNPHNVTYDQVGAAQLNHVHNLATAEQHGFLSFDDKNKLDKFAISKVAPSNPTIGMVWGDISDI